ncbi:hypothetical protein ES724_02720 [Gillisia hiemivivida]|uniref:Uncharacterized protein n=1 Tax=Gillisia hiemivivida TaxID=291190 RepID=A0A5C6ZZ62_9FLAO|nr:hypothetical protein ES724_02720 [Gillisia hiemivivida]
MQCFIQAFAGKRVDPENYDLLMEIYTEEFNYLEIMTSFFTRSLIYIPLIIRFLTQSIKNYQNSKA